MPPQAFKGQMTTYRDKVRDAETARNDPDGFYHGVKITHAGKVFVMSGPPAIFMADRIPERPNLSPKPEAQQLDLF